MAQVAPYDTPEFRALMASLEEEWPHRRAELRAAGIPLNEGDDDDADDANDDQNDDADADNDKDAGETFPASVVKKLREENAGRRKENAELKTRLKEIEDAEKSELEKAQESAASLETRATAAETAALRLEVALDKAPEGMPLAQVRKLAKRLTGTTQEEIEADAEELFAEFASDDGQEPPAGGRPQPRLRPGATHSSEPEEMNPHKLAEAIPRY